MASFTDLTRTGSGAVVSWCGTQKWCGPQSWCGFLIHSFIVDLKE